MPPKLWGLSLRRVWFASILCSRQTVVTMTTTIADLRQFICWSPTSGGGSERVVIQVLWPGSPLGLYIGFWVDKHNEHRFVLIKL